MKKVDQLTRKQLEMALEAIQFHAFAEFETDDRGYLDPEKELGSDFIGSVVEALRFVDLVPKRRTRFKL
jgi:hypothetical protein